MTDWKTLAERLDTHAEIHENERVNWYGADAEQVQWSQDLRTAAQLARERAEQESRQHTHAEGCWTWGPKHYDCALREISRLQPGARERAEAQTKEEAGATYGIIDPDYGRVYTIARKLAWEEGYAIGLHGSFTRDLDMIAVPWTDSACEPEHLIRRIVDATGLKLRREPSSKKPHGRLAWSLHFPAFGDPRFVDLSVMPSVNKPTEAQITGHHVSKAYALCPLDLATPDRYRWIANYLNDQIRAALAAKEQQE